MVRNESFSPVVTFVSPSSLLCMYFSPKGCCNLYKFSLSWLRVFLLYSLPLLLVSLDQNVYTTVSLCNWSKQKIVNHDFACYTTKQKTSTFPSNAVPLTNVLCNRYNYVYSAGGTVVWTTIYASGVSPVPVNLVQIPSVLTSIIM